MDASSDPEKCRHTGTHRHTNTDDAASSTSADKKPLIVAEIGSGHGGNRNIARQLIQKAAWAGADIVKFQHFYADEIVHPLTGNVPLPGGDIPLYRRFKELETDAAFLVFLADCATQEGVEFFCSPFGLRSAAELRETGQNRAKIASPELNHHPLLRWSARNFEKMVLSTGVSSLGDIEESLELIRNAAPGHCPELTLLHCITSYPSPEEEYNLLLIPNLSAIFGIPAGVSDHSRDPVLVPAISTLFGAVMIEKHFTLDRSGGGLDDPIALNPEEFRRMTSAIREAEKLIDLPFHRAWKRHSVLKQYDPALIAAVCGDGVKHLAPAERQNYGKSNRSIHIRNSAQAGHVLTRNDLTILRSEKNLRPGLHPRHLEELYGCVLARNIDAGQGVLWQDLLP